MSKIYATKGENDGSRVKHSRRSRNRISQLKNEIKDKRL